MKPIEPFRPFGFFALTGGVHTAAFADIAATKYQTIERGLKCLSE
jgi:hypothetical protein